LVSEAIFSLRKLNLDSVWGSSKVCWASWVRGACSDKGGCWGFESNSKSSGSDSGSAWELSHVWWWRLVWKGVCPGPGLCTWPWGKRVPGFGFRWWWCFFSLRTLGLIWIFYCFCWHHCFWETSWVGEGTCLCDPDSKWISFDLNCLIQTKYLQNERNLNQDNQNVVYLNFLEIFKSPIQTHDKDNNKYTNELKRNDIKYLQRWNQNDSHRDKFFTKVVEYSNASLLKMHSIDSSLQER